MSGTAEAKEPEIQDERDQASFDEACGSGDDELFAEESQQNAAFELTQGRTCCEIVAKRHLAAYDGVASGELSIS